MALSSFITEAFYNDLSSAAEKIREADDIRVIAHYDGDGTSAAIILASAFERLGKRYHVGFIKALDSESFKTRIMEDTDSLTVVVDAGSDQVKSVPEVEKIIVLDHHFYEETQIRGLNINARKYGIDGTREACGATMAFVMALTLDENNRDLFPYLMAGIIADKQDIGEYRGLNKSLYENYSGMADKIHTLNLEGDTILNALVYSTDPFINDITGNVEKTVSFLKELQIDPETRFLDLNEDQKRSLGKSLSIRLIAQGIGTEALKYLETDILKFSNTEFTSKELGAIIDGNTKIDCNAVAMQYFLGDSSARKELVDNWKIFKAKLIDYTYRSFNQLFTLSNVNYFYAPESEMAGAVCGLLMLYLAPQDKPLVGFNVGSGDTKVSSRGTRRMVQKGLNLSTVMKNATAEVGGSGGGHDIAAGAVIPKGKEKVFIDAVNRIVKEAYGKF